MKALAPIGVVLCGAIIAGCGSSMNNTCQVNAAVTPASATADHTAASPGNQVQYTVQGTVTGNCPLLPDTLGTWSTSDPVRTSIAAQPNDMATATCLAGTNGAVIISTSGTVHGHSINSGTLTCK